MNCGPAADPDSVDRVCQQIWMFSVNLVDQRCICAAGPVDEFRLTGVPEALVETRDPRGQSRRPSRLVELYLVPQRRPEDTLSGFCGIMAQTPQEF